MDALQAPPRRRRHAAAAPWLVLTALTLPAVWHVLDFPDDVDPEFPKVARPTFSRRPPPAYRLAEPGDTIDRVAIYLSAGAIVLSLYGRLTRGGEGWTASALLATAALWHAATPGPTFDAWHGLGWRLIFDGAGPPRARVFVAGLLILLTSGLAFALRRFRSDWRRSLAFARDSGALGLFVVGLCLVAMRQSELFGVEPAGYWPRWFFVWGIAAWMLGLLVILSRSPGLAKRREWALRIAGGAAWTGLVVGGIWLTWYHRPLSRLRTVEPGRIYISAMPTYRGLEIAQARHGFKTIINVFAEDTHQRSPLLPDELRFVKEHGIRYLNAPAEQSKADEFIDETLRIAQDPDAWPILVHCHGCMDRSPAWMGMYRFLVQRRPIDEIMREIEGHRGYRPKASVTLLLNRVLTRLAPDRYRDDPAGRLLLKAAEGTVDPFFEIVRREREAASLRR